MDEQKMPRRPRRSSTEEQPRNESLVYGKNPVTELLKSGSGVDTVLIAEGMAPAVAAYYTAMAKEAGATVKRVHPNKLRLMTGTESHQGVAAFASEIEYVTVEDLLNVAREKVKALFFLGDEQASRLAKAAMEGIKDKNELKNIINANPSVDIALFGRMVADDPSLNEDASCQVAHAISTHAVQNESLIFIQQLTIYLLRIMLVQEC